MTNRKFLRAKQSDQGMSGKSSRPQIWQIVSQYCLTCLHVHIFKCFHVNKGTSQQTFIKTLLSDMFPCVLSSCSWCKDRYLISHT